MLVELGVVAEQRGAIFADDFGIVAHVAEDMRMVEGRPCADAHEFLGSDLDHRNTGIVLEMRNDVIGHIAEPQVGRSLEFVGNGPYIEVHHSGAFA